MEEELERFAIIDDGCDCKRESGNADACPTGDCVCETLKALITAVVDSSMSPVRARRVLMYIC